MAPETEPGVEETEAQILAQIRLELGKDPDVVLWRNSTGVAEAWDPKSGRARYALHGLGPGSADLIGLVKPSGRFLALEVKSAKGKLSKEQVRWLDLVRAMGGVAWAVRSVVEAREAVREAKGSWVLVDQGEYCRP